MCILQSTTTIFNTMEVIRVHRLKTDRQKVINKDIVPGAMKLTWYKLQTAKETVAKAGKTLMCVRAIDCMKIGQGGEISTRSNLCGGEGTCKQALSMDSCAI